MTLANKITLSRIPNTILFLYASYTINFPLIILTILYNYITDNLDGYIARKRNQVTKLGSILDSTIDGIFHISLILSLYLIKKETITKILDFYPFLIIILTAILLRFIIAKIKFKTSIPLHPLLSKLQAATIILTYIYFIFKGYNQTILIITLTTILLAYIEMIFILILSKKPPKQDLRSILEI